MSLQQEIIAALGVKPTIDAAEEVAKRTDFLKQQIKASGTTGLLIAISGGLDSAVAAALCKQATDELAAETGQPYETLGVYQPYGKQEDIEDSYAVGNTFDLKTVETNIEEAVDEIALETEYALKAIHDHRHVSIPGKGNIKARTRMVLQYALANERKLLVVGTDHASEAITGFFTKYGDGAVDVVPLSSLNKRQVRQLAKHLGVPRQIIDKAPSAGLWAGQTDEEELGISYEANSDYLEGKRIDPAQQEKLELQYTKTAHKRNPLPGI